MSILALIYVLSESFVASFCAFIFAGQNPALQNSEALPIIALWGVFFSAILIISQIAMMNQDYFYKLSSLAWRTFEVPFLAFIASLAHGSLKHTLYYIILYYFFSYSGRMLGYVYSMLSSPMRAQSPITFRRVAKYMITIVVPIFGFYLIPAMIPIYYGIPYTDPSGSIISFLIGLIVLGGKAVQYGHSMDKDGSYFTINAS